MLTSPKVALLKKTILDSGDLASYRSISNLPFISKILNKVVVKSLCDYLHRNSLYEDLQSKSQYTNDTLAVTVIFS